MNKLANAPVLAALLFGAPCLAADCFTPASVAPSDTVSMVAPEMIRGTVADPQCVSVQDVLARLRAVTSPASTPDSAYVPRTKDDNSPWRFDMSQNGKRMTSAEFDAWMKAKGIRVATGKPGTTAPAADPALAAPDGAVPPAPVTGK